MIYLTTLDCKLIHWSLPSAMMYPILFVPVNWRLLLRWIPDDYMVSASHGGAQLEVFSESFLCLLTMGEPTASQSQCLSHQTDMVRRGCRIIVKVLRHILLEPECMIHAEFLKHHYHHTILDGNITTYQLLLLWITEYKESCAAHVTAVWRVESCF